MGKKHPAMRPFQVSFQHGVCWAYPSILVRMAQLTKCNQGVKHSSEIHNQLPLSEKSPCPVRHQEGEDTKRNGTLRGGEEWCKVFALPAVWYLETTWFNMKKIQKLF